VIANEEPEIIDRLEFDRDLRCLDCVEEVAFLGLECRVIGQSWIENECIACYRADGGDPAPTHLWHFYAARRATMRAMLSAWHTLDTEGTDHWLRRGRSYLDLAADYLEGAATL
jgi:aminoglycoside phosphotransferase family enzyme